VVDADGRQLTAMVFEAEQYRQLQALGEPVGGPARITALGVAVQVHPDAHAFAASPGSQLDPAADPDQEPPPHYREQGWSWPPRLAAESFIAYGVFADLAQARPRARLSGTVLKAGTTSARSPGSRSPSPPSAPPDSRPTCAWPTASIPACQVGAVQLGSDTGLVYIGPAAGKTGAWTQNRDMRESSSRPRAHPAFC
jgi:hypothetical protein